MKTLYLDMDGVLVDIQPKVQSIRKYLIEFTNYKGEVVNLAEQPDRVDEVPFLFENLPPMEGAIDSFKRLSEIYDIYILSTAPWNNPDAWLYKRMWVEEHLGAAATKRLILSHHKNLMIGEYLVDDRTKNGAGEFKGEHLLFGGADFPDWKTTLEYLEQNA